jgi:S1-C subfamily serine protease
MILAAGQGLGFSLPIDLVKTVLSQLKEKGKVERSWMGLVIQEITIDLKERLGLKVGQGAYVVQVVQNSPAAQSGLKEGDVVIEFNGKPIKHSRELPLICANSPAGVPLPYKVIRDGKIITLEVTLQKVPQPKM